MILGMSLPAFTLFHVALSLIAIAAGLVVLLIFVAAGIVALRSFHPEAGPGTLRALTPQRG